MTLSRRRFMIGIAAISSAAASYWLIQPQRFNPITTPIQHLSATQTQVLQALAPALLSGALMSDTQPADVKRLITNIDAAIGILAAHSRDELLLLLDLMSRRGSFMLLSRGVNRLPDMSMMQRIELLKGWQNHSLATLNQTYQGLHELFMAAWYGDPLSWEAIHYQLPSPFNRKAS
jgi:hypothetical protein